ncbi:MAG TPA: hypothetical protein VIW23_10240 [Candidatus Acidoferrum sp.]|jgi:hypothetical protein
MTLVSQSVLLRFAVAVGFVAFAATRANAQVPVPVAVPVVETAVPIIVNTVKPNKGPQPPKFEGTVINATVAQITVRAKGNDMAIQTFPLTPAASAKMLAIIDKGGYQYGDKVTVFFDPDSKAALKVKGKPSKPT